MTQSPFRNMLIVAGIAAAFGVGVAGCDNTAENRAADAPTRTASTANATTDNTRDATQATRNAGDDAAQAVSDTWITTKVKSVLLADSEAKGLDIEVDTKDGVVTLEGELTSQAAVDHVKALARDVEGVKRVNFSALTVARR